MMYAPAISMFILTKRSITFISYQHCSCMFVNVKEFIKYLMLLSRFTVPIKNKQNSFTLIINVFFFYFGPAHIGNCGGWEAVADVRDPLEKQSPLLKSSETKTIVSAQHAVISINTLRSWQNGRHLPDDNFKSIFLNENVRISIKTSLKFVPKGPIDNIPALVQMMAWRRLGDKPLSEPIMVRLPTHICVTRP